MTIQALIVDDESLARKRVRKLLAQEQDMEIMGECANGPEAIEFIRERQPDLVFMDVQMPEVSGFDVLRALPAENLPAVIFVTAHDKHAIEAFEVHALDYLLKPFTQARFREAVRRTRQHLQAARGGAAMNQQFLDWLKSSKPDTPCLSRIAIKTGDRTFFVKVEEVDYFESASNYVVLHTRTENHILRDTLTSLESRLSSRSFLRVSRSVIVNLDRIKELQPGVQGEHVIVLHSNKALAMTRGLREVQERLEYS